MTNRSAINLFTTSILLTIFLTFESHNFLKHPPKTSAIIFSSSTGYYNYRQTTNVVRVYEILRQNNFKAKDILLAIPENSGCCEKNQLLGTLSFEDNDYRNMNTGLEIDRQYSTLSLEGVVDMFRGKYHRYLPNRFRIPDSERLFVFVTGHGGDYYFKIRERDAILDEHFRFIFQELSNRTAYESVFLMTDSCSASTPFQTIDASNFIALASSSFDEKSLSHGHDSTLNTAKSDDFSFYLSEYFKQNSLEFQKVSVKELKKYMDFQKLKVNSKIVSASLSGNQNVNKYMRQEKKINKRKFILQSI